LRFTENHVVHNWNDLASLNEEIWLRAPYCNQENISHFG